MTPTLDDVRRLIAAYHAACDDRSRGATIDDVIHRMRNDARAESTRKVTT